MSASALPKVVVMGGGTGTFMMLMSLKQLPVDLTAILTMVDDGGSNKVLRDQFGLLPTSGVRQAMVALSENDTLLRALFNYRFHQGEGLTGMTFGNLFMAAMADVVGSQKQALEETAKLLQVKGKILPISYDDVRLVATYEDGTEVVGEHEIDEPHHDGKLHISSLRTEPVATLSEEARAELLDADYIIMGPGDFYTNTVANLVVSGVKEALQTTKAKVIFVTNLMTKFGETYGFTLRTFMDELDKYLGIENLDVLLVNNNTAYPASALQKYTEEQAVPVADDIAGDTYRNCTILRDDLLAENVFEKDAGDALSRSILRHDPQKFADVFARQFLGNTRV